MKMELAESDEAAAAAFRDNVFLHSGPQFYQEAYGDEEVEVDEWMIPESVEDLREFAQVAAEAGIPLDFGPLLGNLQGTNK
jgi:hypothetical protein